MPSHGWVHVRPPGGVMPHGNLSRGRAITDILELRAACIAHRRCRLPRWRRRRPTGTGVVCLRAIVPDTLARQACHKRHRGTYVAACTMNGQLRSVPTLFLPGRTRPGCMEDGRQHMSVIDRTGQPLPDTHPLKNKALIIAGQRSPTHATPESTTPATPNDTCTP